VPVSIAHNIRRVRRMDLGLAGKNAIVTGGGSNIGRAITFTLAQEGTNVLIADFDEPQAKKTAEEASALGGGRVIACKTDVTKLAEVEAAVKKAVDEFGRLDILVNNVGVENLMFFVETTPDFWDMIVDVNYKGVLRFCRTVLPIFIEQKSGAIVNIGSDSAKMGDIREATYAGAKGAVMSFTRVIAKENGRFGIRANVVNPGATPPGGPEDAGELSMAKGALAMFTDEMKAKFAKVYPLQRLGEAQDIANAVAFLASDRASFITGQTLSVSGGYSVS
jgi:NAD(P)-dependent dehydrogenase (short-subunit alcohol dehydrogenase family)